MITNYTRAKKALADAEHTASEAWDAILYDEYLTALARIEATRIYLAAAEEALKSVMAEQ